MSGRIVCLILLLSFFTVAFAQSPSDSGIVFSDTVTDTAVVDTLDNTPENAVQDSLPVDLPLDDALTDDTLSRQSNIPEFDTFYQQAMQSYRQLKEAVLENLPPEILEELEILESSAEDLAEEGFYETARELIEEAASTAEQFVEPVTEELPPGKGLEKQSDLTAELNLSRYGELSDTSSVVLDDSNWTDREWTVGASWGLSLEKEADNLSWNTDNTVHADNDVLEDNFESEINFHSYGKSEFVLNPELYASLNLPDNTMGDSTSSLIPAVSAGYKYTDHFKLLLSTETAFYKRDILNYADYWEPALEVMISEMKAADIFTLDADVKYAQRNHFKNIWQTEDYRDFQGNLLLEIAGESAWSVSSENFIEIKRLSRVNYDGDFSLMENILDLEKTFMGIIQLGAEISSEQTFYVYADSSGGYRYANRVISLLPDITGFVTENLSLCAGYTYAGSVNRDNSGVDTTGISLDDYKQNGAKLELQWSGEKTWFIITDNLDRKNYVNTDDNYSNEIVNTLSVSMDRTFLTKWSLAAGLEWAWYHYNADNKYSDLSADISLTRQLF